MDNLKEKIIKLEQLKEQTKELLTKALEEDAEQAEIDNLLDLLSFANKMINIAKEKLNKGE